VGGPEKLVIDYVMVRGELTEEMEERMDSNHMPVVIRVKEGVVEREGGDRRCIGGGGMKLEGKHLEKNWGRWYAAGKSIQEEVKIMGGRIAKALGNGEKAERRVGGKGIGWWNNECKEKKRRARSLREWGEEKRKESEYKKEKREYKELCERKKREENERWERMMGEDKSIG